MLLLFFSTFCAGVLGSETSFGAFSRKSQSVHEEEDDPEDAGLQKEGLNTLVLSRQNTGTEDESRSGLLSSPHLL